MLRSSQCGDALGGHNQAMMEVYLEAVSLEAEVQEGGMMGAETLLIC